MDHDQSHFLATSNTGTIQANEDAFQCVGNVAITMPGPHRIKMEYHHFLKVNHLQTGHVQSIAGISD